MNLEHGAYEETTSKVTMVQEYFVAPDGVNTHYVERGDVVHVPEHLAHSLIRDGLAVCGEVKKDTLPEPRKAHDTLSKLDNAIAHPASAAAKKSKTAAASNQKFYANDKQPADPLNGDYRGPKDIRDDKNSRTVRQGGANENEGAAAEEESTEFSEVNRDEFPVAQSDKQ